MPRPLSPAEIILRDTIGRALDQGAAPADMKALEDTWENAEDE